jgi:hypothetical protein
VGKVARFFTSEKEHAGAGLQKKKKAGSGSNFGGKLAKKKDFFLQV